MALPTNISRPEFPYIPLQVLANNDRYQIITLRKNSPPYQYLDQEMNCVFDWLNTISDALNNTAAGIIPGADDPANINKIPTPTNLGNIAWQLIQNNNMDVNCVDTDNIIDRAITTNKHALASITDDLLAAKSVPAIKIDAGAATANQVLLATGLQGEAVFDTFVAGTANYGDNTITAPKLAAKSVPAIKIDAGAATANQVLLATGLQGEAVFDTFVAGTANYGDNTITAPKLAAKSVPAIKIDAGAATANQVLLATGLQGEAVFGDVPSIGRILQIVPFVKRNTAFQTASGTFASFDTPLQVSITMKNSNSTIVVYLSANVSAQSDEYPMSCLGALFKNGSIWTPQTGNTASGGAQTNCLQEIICPDVNSMAPMNYLALDTGGASGTRNTYELRVMSGRPGYGSYLNRTPSGNGGRTVSSIYAIEIGLHQ